MAFSKVITCVQVSVKRITAMRTEKETFGTSTEFSAVRTPLATKIRIDLDDTNPILHSFILDEALQLIEAPAVEPEVDSFAFPHLPYTFQIFQSDSSCFATINYPFADYMIPVSLETPLPAGNLLEQFLGRTSAFALESCSQTLEFEPVSFYLIPAKELPVACYSDMVYTYINTKTSIATQILDVDISDKCYVEEHETFTESCSHGLPVPIEIFPIAFRDFDWDVNPAFGCCDSDLIKAECESSFVKVQGQEFLESGFASFVGFGRFEGLGSDAVGIYDELGRKPELFSGFIIAEMVKLVSVCDSSFKAPVSDVGDSFGILPHSIEKQSVRRNLDFYRSNGLHKFDVEKIIYNSYPHLTSVQCHFSIPPTTKVVGILEVIL